MKIESVPEGSQSTLQQCRVTALMTEGTVFEKVKSSGGTNNAKVQEACVQREVNKSNPWKEKEINSTRTLWGSALWPVECTVNSNRSRQSKTQQVRTRGQRGKLQLTF